MSVTIERALEIANEYIAACNSHDPSAIASFYAPNGCIYVNGVPSNGRDEVAAMAKSFLDAIPDMTLRLDVARSTGTHLVGLWTFEGTNSTNGNKVTMSGWEYVQLNEDGLIAETRGHFDEAEYERQMG